MFGLFKKKSKIDVLQKQYQRLLEEAFQLSKTDRMKSDQKQAEAADLLKEIEALRSKENK